MTCSVSAMIAASTSVMVCAGAAIAAGPDVIGRDFNGVARQGTVGTITAYTLGPTTCNVGSAFLGTNFGTPDHPAIGMNLYRLQDGRFEQVGMSWAFHMICSLQLTGCGVCQPPPGGGCNNELGLLCSTSDTATFCSQTVQLGPRSQINAATGVFAFPFTAPAAPATIGRRLQVHNDDLDPALNPGATYFGEFVYVSADDAGAGNSANNATHRRVLISGPTGGPYTMGLTGSASQGAPALLEWAAADSGVQVSIAEVPGEGRFYVASKATQISCNRYRYEYAVFNLSSDRSAGSFSVPFAAPDTASSIGFHDVDYHSGETISGADWTAAPGVCELSWSTEDFASNPDANAIRWGTLYNFRFETHWAPTSADASIGLFKTGAPGFVNAGVVSPGAEPAFAGDYDGDGAVGLSDAAIIINNWFNPCGSAGIGGMASIINHWAESCP